MAAEYDIDVVIGDSWPPGPFAEFLLVIRESENGDTFTPVNLTGTIVTQSILHKGAAPAGAPVLSLDIKNQTTSTGEIGIRLNATESAKLENLTYHWSLKIRFDAENILTPIMGLIRTTGLS